MDFEILNSNILRSMSESEGSPIIVVGGHRRWPRSYRNLAHILEEISGSTVHVVPLTPLDWLLGRVRGFGQLVFEIASKVDKALMEHDSRKAILVGHSAGGILCRTYLGGDAPYGGRRWSGHRRVSHLITLGTPHVVPDKDRFSTIAEISRLFPGALHSGSVRYRSVAGSATDGTISTKYRNKYGRFTGEESAAGDGVVPVSSALLPGSEHLTLDGVWHGPGTGPRGSRWYGSDRETVLKWWPAELREDAVAAGTNGERAN